jgi:hypothetical protein
MELDDNGQDMGGRGTRFGKLGLGRQLRGNAAYAEWGILDQGNGNA